MPKANKSNLYLYNRSLKEYARENRNKANKAECCLWKFVLSAKRMKGYTFRRQRPVLNYIADFMCKELNLIIEVDGTTHTWETTSVNDKYRQRCVEEAGFTVLRFTNEEVLTAIDLVYEKIEEKIEQLLTNRKKSTFHKG